jgi:predicted SAM-dependent methyltransferase
MKTGIRTRFQSWSQDRKRNQFQAQQKARIQKYLEKHATIWLHIGAGFNVLDGWLNTDYLEYGASTIYLDIRKRFPFEDSAVDLIFSEHVIPHLDYSEGQFMLSECNRILKPGGRLRIAAPNFDFVVSLCANPKSDVQQKYISWFTERFLKDSGNRPEVFVLNQFFGGWGLKFLYDPSTLCEALTRAGFVDIRSYRPGVSDEVSLQGLEKHGSIIGEEFNQLETFVLEAAKASPDRLQAAASSK